MLSSKNCDKYFEWKKTYKATKVDENQDANLNLCPLYSAPIDEKKANELVYQSLTDLSMNKNHEKSYRKPLAERSNIPLPRHRGREKVKKPRSVSLSRIGDHDGYKQGTTLRSETREISGQDIGINHFTQTWPNFLIQQHPTD